MNEEAACLQRGVNDLHMVQLMPLLPHHLLLQIGLTFLLPAYTVCPGKEANKHVSVCLKGDMQWFSTQLTKK